MTSLAALARRARPEAVAVARMVLERDAADQLWAEQVGPALSQQDTAVLLAKTEQAVAKDQRLLRVRTRDGRPTYPVVQFAGRAQLAGVAAVVATLRPVLDDLGIAGWLTGQTRDGLGRPVDQLRAGQVEEVLVVARRLADRLA